MQANLDVLFFIPACDERIAYRSDVEGRELNMLICTGPAESLSTQSKSAGVMAAADLHFVQHLPSNICSNSGQ